MSGDGGRYNVPGLERGLRILQAFTPERPERAAGDIARDLDVPRSTVFRLIQTLEGMGFLIRGEGNRTYRLGPAVLSIGFSYLSSLELPEVARPELEALRDDTGVSSHLGIRDGDEVVYLLRCAGRSALASNIRVGSRIKAHGASMGRVMLADLSREELTAIYGDGPLEAFSSQTPSSVDDLARMLADDAARGYVISQSYYERGVASVAAPVRDGSGRVVAAINVTGSEQVLPVDRINGAVLDRVLAAAALISTWLGSAETVLDRAPQAAE